MFLYCPHKLGQYRFYCEVWLFSLECVFCKVICAACDGRVAVVRAGYLPPKVFDLVSIHPLYYDGTNEKGLSMAGHNFPQNAVISPSSISAAVAVPHYINLPHRHKAMRQVFTIKSTHFSNVSMSFFARSMAFLNLSSSLTPLNHSQPLLAVIP